MAKSRKGCKPQLRLQVSMGTKDSALSVICFERRCGILFLHVRSSKSDYTSSLFKVMCWHHFHFIFYLPRCYFQVALVTPVKEEALRGDDGKEISERRQGSAGRGRTEAWHTAMKEAVDYWVIPFDPSTRQLAQASYNSFSWQALIDQFPICVRAY